MTFQIKPDYYVRRSSNGRFYAFSYRTATDHQGILERYDAAYTVRSEGRNKDVEDVELRSEVPAFILEGILGYQRKTGKRPQEVKIVEFGAGVGAYSFYLLGKGYDVEMSDYSEVCVEKILRPRLRTLGLEPERAFAADLFHLAPHLVARYDICLLVGVVYEYEDFETPGRAYGELSRCLKDGHGLFIHVLNSFENRFVRWRCRPLMRAASSAFDLFQKPTLYARRSRFLMRMLGKSPLVPEFRFWLYRAEDIERMLKATGYQVTKTQFLDVAQGIAEYVDFARHHRSAILYANPLNRAGELVRQAVKNYPQWFAKRIGFVAEKAASLI